MKRRAFLLFVAPSMISMLLLIALPLVGVAYLALHQSHVKTELAEVVTEVPLFGGLKREVTSVVPQPVFDEEGKTIRVWEFVGGRNLRNAVQIGGLREIIAGAAPVSSIRDFTDHLYKEVSDVDFWSAL